jgi:hypothetical protein
MQYLHLKKKSYLDFLCFRQYPNVAHKISIIIDKKNSMTILNFVIIRRKKIKFMILKKKKNKILYNKKRQ